MTLSKLDPRALRFSWLLAFCTLTCLVCGSALAQDGAEEDEEPPLEIDLDEEDDAPLDIPMDDDVDGDEDSSGDDAEEDETTSGDAQEAEEGDPLTLPGDDPLQIAPVYVRYSKSEIAEQAGSATVLDETLLDNFEQDDPHTLLLMVPGVYVRTEDAYGLRPNIGIRGASAERSKKITLMEDGVLLAPAPYAAPAAYYFPLMTRMDAVEVFKGPSAIKYGPHTVGGAINMVSRDIPLGTRGGIDVAGGMYATGKLDAHFGAGNDWVGFLVEASHLQSDGFKELDGGGDTGFDKTEIYARLRLNTSLDDWDFHRFDIRVGVQRERSAETYLGLSDADFEDNPYRRYAGSQLGEMRWDRLLGHLNYTMELGDDFDLRTTLYRHDFNRSWTKLNGFVEGTPLKDIVGDPTGRRAVLFGVLKGEEDSASDEEVLIVGTNARTFFSQGVQAIGHHRYANDVLANELEFGVRVHNDQIERNHTEDTYEMRSGLLVPTGDSTTTATRNVGSAFAVALHAVDSISFFGLTLTPGVRFEYIKTRLEDRLTNADTDGDQIVVLPGLGVFYGITEHIGVLAGFNRGFSPVSPGQPDGIEPETSWNFEAGARFWYEPSNSLLEVVGFFNDYRNLLGECSFSIGCREEQIDDQFALGEIFIWGVEVAASHTFEVGGFQIPLRATYTYTGSEFQTSFVSQNPQFGAVSEGDAMPYIPAHQVSAQVGFGNDQFGLHAANTFVSAMREQAGQESLDQVDSTDAYYMLDLVLHVSVVENFEVYGKVDNVTATRAIASRRPYGARPVKPTLAQLGVKASF